LFNAKRGGNLYLREIASPKFILRGG